MAERASGCNVLCMKWGSKFDASYVNRLYAMVRERLQRPHRFVCLTDDATGIDPGVETLPLPEVGWDDEPDINLHGWRKVGLMAPQIGDLQGTALFLDLDVVIVDALDPFFDLPGEVFMIRDFRKVRIRGDRFVGNTSVFRFELGVCPELYERFRSEFPAIRGEVRNEQEYLSHHFHQREQLHHWPAQWCASFKHDCVGWGLPTYFRTPRIPPGTAIVVFHGRPSPRQAVTGDGGKWYRHIRPTPWIQDYWRTE